MPEGPSLVIAREGILQFQGQRIDTATGNASIDFNAVSGQTIKRIRTWGKHLLLELDNVVIRIHFLMFGSYSVNEQTKLDRSIRLRLNCSNGSVYFYTCSVKLLSKSDYKAYDWSADVLSRKWNSRAASKKLREQPDMLVCDALLDQQIFSGVGNIIKNEVLYRILVHPETKVGNLPPRKKSALIKEARQYSFDFLKWKRAFELKKHWLAHTKKKCRRCGSAIQKKYCGKTKRRSFFCPVCQVLYK